MKRVILTISTLATIFILIYHTPQFHFFNEEKMIPNDIENVAYPDSPDKFDLLHHQLRNREQLILGRTYSTNYQIKELNKLKSSKSVSRSRYESLDWQERGPGNVPGRTRALLVVDGDQDKNTWFAGSASGGVWKTTDAGQSWDLKTPDIPNLATTVLAKSASSDQIMYAGTGEFFNSVGGVDGNGIFKSINGGDTWTQMAATANNPDFKNTFRIIVDPNDPNILVAAVSETTRKIFQPDLRCSLYKSIDGGNTWSQKHMENRRIQDLIFHSDDFSIQYASVNSTGILKSTDSGETWELLGQGILTSGRLEIAIAPTNANRLYASVEGSISGAFGTANPTGTNGSDLYVSYDAAQTWELLIEENGGVNHNFLDGQGGYDNTIIVHPFDENIVYVGGVDLWKMEMGAPQGEIPAVSEIDTTNVGFINFIGFGASFFGGRLETGNNNQATSLSDDDFVDVEIRFGTGLSQMAHRFSINPTGGANGDDGAGVQPNGYLYEDYVEVPFQVWDVINNKQLMISFRDQENDGAWDLEVRDTNDATIGREYFYINAVGYNPNAPDANIALDAGHSYKQIYFMWPSLAAGFAFDPDNLPEAKIAISKGSLSTRDRVTENISDSRAQYAGKNASTQTIGEQNQTELHPDHHNLLAITIDNTAQTFKILNSNDGGVFVSNTSTLPGVNDGDWTFSGTGYNTSQFYGVDKRRGKHEYFGGMQDNGSWRSARNEDASLTSKYSRQITGDGFEAVWHYGNEDWLIGTSQGNNFRKSINGGRDWGFALTGYTETTSPFVSKLANSKNNPDYVYSVGSSGVWKSVDFGDNWEQRAITDQWVDFGFVMDVKISLADHNIVWAGGGMTANSVLHVSTDGGETFEPTKNLDPIDLLGRISGIETHPTEDSTAFVLFSFASGPKVIKTIDLGETWTELSGFGEDLVSASGFPNVAVNTLLVMPYDPSIIWVGTEIGVVESTDAGATWHLLDSDLPAVSVWELKIVDDQVIAATHGRGIWSVEIPEINLTPFITSYNEIKGMPPELLVDVRDAYDSLDIYMDDNFLVRVKNPSEGINEIEIPVEEDGIHKFTAISYVPDVAYRSGSVTLLATIENVTALENESNEHQIIAKVFPNPAAINGSFNVQFNDVAHSSYSVRLYTLNGHNLSVTTANKTVNSLSIDSPSEKGIYLMSIYDGSTLIETKRILVY